MEEGKGICILGREMARYVRVSNLNYLGVAEAENERWLKSGG
jgi:hypothetical protein